MTKMDRYEQQMRHYNEALPQRSPQVDRCDPHSAGGRSKSHEDQCECGLPNKRYCMLNPQPCSAPTGFLNRHKLTRRGYEWVPMSICSV